jgi:uncharacterized LabA/DUF88 family protein
MRSHSALYVDAGYLIAAAATRLTGSSFRHGVQVDYARLLADLVELVEERTGLPILRVYWYDAARDGKPTLGQEQIALLPKVKLRLGRVGVEGEQKGVDLRIGLDMVGHSRNGAVDTMYLLSGDDDLTEAVEEAQAQGVQVIILAVPSRAGARHGVSRHLMLAADDLEVLDSHVLDVSVRTPVVHIAGTSPFAADERVAAQPSPADIARLAMTLPLVRPTTQAVHSGATLAYSSAAPETMADYDPGHVAVTVSEVATKTYDAWAAAATDAQRDELRAGRPSIPRDLDRALLVDLSDALGEYTLSDAVRFTLRAAFWEAADRL